MLHLASDVGGRHQPYLMAGRDQLAPAYRNCAAGRWLSRLVAGPLHVAFMLVAQHAILSAVKSCSR